MPRRRRKVDPEQLSPIVLVVLAAIALAWLLDRWEMARAPRPLPSAPSGQVLFCAWNVENLFDDEDDPTFRDPTEDWFGRDPAALRAKLDLLASALLAQNGGKGPDLLAIVEVENRRAAELLRLALNARLEPRWQYDVLVHRDNRTGRRIEPALISRLPAEEDTSRDHGARRILAVNVGSPAAPLRVVIAHWTSRVTDSTGEKRAAYARALYRDVLAWTRIDPGADVLLAGDFNDEPGDPSVRIDLRATADPAEVRLGDDRPRLLNLSARIEGGRQGTYFYKGRWEQLDQVIASPGLLDPAGWSVVPDSFRIMDDSAFRVGLDRRPRRFGPPDEPGRRGPSDHFAVTVRLVAPGPAAPALSAR